MSFEFATANRILFGAGKLNELGGLIEPRMKRALLVRGRSSDAIPRAREVLSLCQMQVIEFEVHGEPTVQVIREGIQFGQGCDLVIGLGGGSVLDTGKAISALVTNPGDPLDYLEVIGRGQALTNAPLSYIAIPTTAGTGTEVTRNAVIESREHRVKVSLRSPAMLPRIALVDPELTYSLPPDVTAATGLDALTQLIEPFVSVKANPITDAICREGIRRAARSLKRAYRNGNDKDAREDMSLASLFGGLALANAALGAVHGFAGPLGGMLQAPHGAVCAWLLPLVMEANLNAFETRQPQHPALQRYAKIARLLTGEPDTSARDGVRWVQTLVHDLKIPPLSAYGLTRSQFPEAVGKVLKSSSFHGNPIPLAESELEQIMERAIEREGFE
ncbi:MAG: iron-containing alcohol dehydrogenase [Chloroflexi bacterium]|nr:iron-containing alcohol dehydrogenase [Chloroflexota bacterium]